MLSLLSAGAGFASPPKPNFLILFADDLGAGDLQVYGHPTTITPNLDKLAAGGVRFTQWYSGFHVCTPSRGSMMTGRLPIRLGLAGAGWEGGVLNSDAVGGLPANETTIAEALKDIGYATKAIGKWHLGQQPQFLPTAHGFDAYYGIPYSDDMGPSAWDMYNSKDRPPLPLIRSSAPGKVEIIEQPTDLNLLSGRYVAEASSFIGNHSSSQRPWFLYHAFNHVHVPDFASKPFCNVTKRGRFGDALMELDDAVGLIMASVKAAGVEKQTITFFTSDNGPWRIMGLAGGSAGPLRDGKQTTWEGGVREPGIITWPGTIVPGRVSDEVVATYDIFVTAVKLAGGTLPSIDLDGRDIAPLLTDPEATSPHECIYYWKGPSGLKCPSTHPECPGLWAVRCGAHKLHFVTKDSIGSLSDREAKFHDPPLIFNIETDPSENYPLASYSAEYEAVRPGLEKAAASHAASILPVPNQMAAGLDPSLRICCDAHSTRTRPSYPACTCNPENFEAFVCGPVGPSSSVIVESRGGVLSAVDIAGDVGDVESVSMKPRARAGAVDPRDSSTWPEQPRMLLQDA